MSRSVFIVSARASSEGAPAASRSTFVSGRAEALRVVAASRRAGVLACCVVNCSACAIAAHQEQRSHGARCAAEPIQQRC